MNKRQIDILCRILEDPQFYTIDKLAEIMNRSERTIYKDLVDINYYFSKYKINAIVLNDRGEIHLDSRERLHEFLWRKIKFADFELNTEERNTLVTCLLLLSDGYITIQKITDLLYCSRSTVLKDMNKIKDELKSEEIHVVAYTNKGFKVESEEVRLREKFVKLCKKHVFLIRIFFRDRIEPCMLQDADISLEKIHKIVVREMIKEKFYLTEDSLHFLDQYLLFCFLRTSFGRKINDCSIENTLLLKVSRNIMENIIIERFESMEGEVQYLSEKIAGLHFAKHLEHNNSLVTIHLLVGIFIEEVSDSLGVDVSADKELVANLSNHIFDILDKAYTEEVENTEVRFYIEKNSNIIECVKKHVYVFENYMGRSLTELELGYVGLHISASLEKFKMAKKRLKILLICNSGVGTVQLLKARLARHYSFLIVDTLSIFQLLNYDTNHVDCIISTVHLGEIVEIPYVCVSINLTKQDIVKIDKMLSLIDFSVVDDKKRKGDDKAALIRNIVPITEKYEGLFPMVEKTIYAYFHEREMVVNDHLSDFLQEEMIRLDVQVDDWVDAIKESVAIFSAKHMVTEKFEKEIIDSIHSYGPYIVISDGVAFPHAGFDQGAIKTGFSFIRLKEPISFASDDTNAKCDLIFSLSAGDNKTHLSALFSLIELANNADFKNDMRLAQSKQEIISCIKRYESTQFS